MRAPLSAPLKATLFAGAIALMTSPVLADEAWQTQMGPAAWESDFGETAVIRIDDAVNARVVRLYMQGLAADVSGGRGVYRGVWIADRGDFDCATQMVGPDGQKSWHWGLFTVTFVNDQFPSDWAGVMGDCVDAPTYPISAVAQVG